MKKIKSNKELKIEKMQLRIRQLELEKELRSSWFDLKQGLHPSTYIKNKLAAIADNNKQNKDLLSNAFRQGMAYLTHQFVTTAGNKVESKVQQGVDTLTATIKDIFVKNK